MTSTITSNFVDMERRVEEVRERLVNTSMREVMQNIALYKGVELYNIRSKKTIFIITSMRALILLIRRNNTI